MYSLTRVINEFQSPLGSAAREETAKGLIEKYESNPPEWEKQDDGTWKAKISDYYYYIVGNETTNYGRAFAGRK